METIISRARAIKILKDHGFTTKQQTATLGGKIVESGTSFDEMLGIKDHYNLKVVKEWLGY